MKRIKIMVALAILGIACLNTSCKEDKFLGIKLSKEKKLEKPDTNAEPSWKSVDKSLELMNKNLGKMLEKAEKSRG